MRPNAIFLGQGTDANGVPCKFYRGWPSGALLVAYDLDALERAEGQRTATTIKQRQPKYRPSVRNRYQRRREQ